MKKKLLSTALGLVVSGGLLALLLSRVELATALPRLTMARPGPLAIAWLLSILLLVARGARFALLGGTRLGATIAATAVQTFLNRVTPFRLGELSLPWLVARHAGGDAARSLVEVILVRLIDLAIVLAAVGVAAMARAGTTDWRFLGAATALAAITIAGLVFLRPLIAASTIPAAWIAARLRSRRGEELVARLRAVAIEQARLPLGGRVALLASSIGIFGMQGVLFAELLVAYDVQLPFEAVVQGSSVAQIGAALPLGGVGSVGTLEASWIAGFVWVGLTQETAVVTAVGCQLVTLAFAAIQGLAAWLWLGRGPKPRPAGAEGQGVAQPPG